MKIAVTGHTKGIGKALYDFYQNKGHFLLGFSRSNGYDIGKKTNEIIEQAKDCEIFFNNAYSGFYQTDILFKLWEIWQNKEKLIINISSMICQSSYPYKYHKFFSKYKVHKIALDIAVKELQETPSKCQVSLISPGSVQTNFLPKISKDQSFLNTHEIVEIANLIILKRKNFKIQNIAFKGIYSQV